MVRLRQAPLQRCTVLAAEAGTMSSLASHRWLLARSRSLPRPAEGHCPPHGRYVLLWTEPRMVARHVPACVDHTTAEALRREEPVSPCRQLHKATVKRAMPAGRVLGIV